MRAVIKRLLAYAGRHKQGYLTSIVFFVAASALEPALPALLGYVLNEGFVKAPSFPLWTVPVVLILIFFGRGLFGFLAQYTMTWSTSRTIVDLRMDLVRALLRADAHLYHEVTPGVAVTKIINDPQNATTQLGGAVTAVLRDGTYTLSMLGYLFYVNWQLSLLLIVSLPALAWAVRQVHRRALRVSGALYGSQLRLVSAIDDIARAWRVVRTFDAGDFELGRFGVEARGHQKLTVKTAAASSLMSPISQLIASLGIAAILTSALVQAHANATRVGDFVAFITGALMLVSRIKSLTDLSQPVIGGLIASRACFMLMDSPPEPDRGRIELDACRGHIRLRGISVRYGGSDRDALTGLDLELQPGTTIALVGASGAGKSTVVNLLLGFVHPSEGLATLDGLPLQDIRKASLRRQFAVVSQDIVLFDGSIADNVVYAKPHDAQRVEDCLRAAQLWDFVCTLPERERTLIGANGSRLSGGQRQRLAIARALYKQAPICIFDEATSSLDTESERAVQSAIENWHGSKTLILIAHRLSTVRNADRIYVLADGRVIEEGAPAELLRRAGPYAGMVQAQSAAA
ncbi:MAG: ATP-binding cassette domain-containing protein [Burkholderiales bacterium]|nr:ATP-binding cassette domain-containing protein [Burkholderiales bacterium]MDE2565859.1 ATP-binding cassette domain-containing protein [Burkholderiales bacterium]